MSVNEKVYKVKEKVQIGPHGVYFVADESHIKNLAYNAGKYPIIACSETDIVEKVCDRKKLTVNN